jgi:hypothetical protein
MTQKMTCFARFFIPWSRRVGSGGLLVFACCQMLAASAAASETDGYGPPSLDFLIQVEKFYADSKHDVQKILACPDKSIRFIAYWRFCNSFKEAEPVIYHDLMHARHRFIGMLTHETKTIPPQWWKESLMRESLYINAEIKQAYRTYHRFRQSVHKAEHNPKREPDSLLSVLDTERFSITANGGSVVRDQDSMTLRYGGIELTLSRAIDDFIRTDFSPYDTFLLHRHNGGLLLAWCDQPHANATWLTSFSADQKVFWEVNLWGNGHRTHERPLGRSVRSWDENTEKYTEFHHFELTVQNDSVTVWGADFSGAYLETIRLADGAVPFRFSTRYSAPAYLRQSRLDFGPTLSEDEQ